uniref:UvrD-like helicase, ATP-binding domain, P-loop containing nucleoside triphosphate hydrolase n=1 Tax=Tanacetum cinerariifolium TaxID=118510 RepID=A0A6L2LKU0_TANCI|nr:UvrD-like helicase, ATP-binding domain, P-loop containing nucleoside triphosphate hydrolase [Tanacetum cinerariifolium]
MTPAHRSTATVYGGDRRSTVAVNDGRWWRTNIDFRRTTGQRWLIGRARLGHGPGQVGLWAGSRSGKVKDFATLANLKVVVANEGFYNIKFKYMGGYWVMIEFQTEVTKLKFQENSAIKTWFSQIQLASSDFNTDGRVTWVKIKGIPLNMWSKNTFNHVALKWGVLLDVDDQEDEHFHRKRICINTNVPTNIFESFKLIYRGKVFWVRAKEVPGWILDFVEDNDEEEDSEVGSYEEVPNGEDVKNV